VLLEELDDPQQQVIEIDGIAGDQPLLVQLVGALGDLLFVRSCLEQIGVIRSFLADEMRLSSVSGRYSFSSSWRSTMTMFFISAR